MRNILVLAGGGDSDRTVFATALAAAQPLAAHLEFFHIQLHPMEAAVWQPHAEFARGAAMRDVMQKLDARLVMRTAEARDHFCQFCEQRGLVVADQRHPGNGVTASWREEIGEADRRLLSTARHYDLVVLARPTGPNGLPPNLLEQLLMGSGRPLLIASAKPPPSLDTIMVCWKETAEAARAVAASMPFLANAKRVHHRCGRRRRSIIVRQLGRSLAPAGLAWDHRKDRIDFVTREAGERGALGECPIATR